MDKVSSPFTHVVSIKKDGHIALQNLAYVIVTKENDHSGVVSYRINEIILQRIFNQPDGCITTVNFWSGGCTSQFRSQYVFYSMNLYDNKLELTFNFFEASHGKGAVDGVEGTVKHRVYR